MSDVDAQEPEGNETGFGTCPDCGGPLDYNGECPGWYEDVTDE